MAASTDPPSDVLLHDQQLCMKMVKNSKLVAEAGMRFFLTTARTGITSEQEKEHTLIECAGFKTCVTSFQRYSTENHTFMIRDEYDCAEKTGGRDILRRKRGADTTGAPASLALATGLSVAHYCHVLALCALSSYNEAVRTGNPNQASPKDLVDARIDETLLGLGWENMEQLALVSSSAEERQRGLQTVGSIETFVNHLRRAWRGLHPPSPGSKRADPLDNLTRVVYAAMGRIAMCAFDKPERMLDSALYTEVGETPDTPTRVAAAFFADRWLILSSMMARRAAISASLKPLELKAKKYRPRPKLARNIKHRDVMEIAWNIVMEGDKCLLADMPRIPSKEEILVWARSMADTPALIEEVLRRVLTVAERVDLMPGDTHLHHVYFPMEDSRPNTVLVTLRGQEEANRVTESVGVSPKALLEDPTRDIDTSALAAACLLRVLACVHKTLNRLAADAAPFDVTCVYWEDTIETELGASVALFTIPVMLQTHGVWVTTLEGEATPPLPFSVALRILLCAFALLELMKTAPFRIIPLIEMINRGVEPVVGE